MNAASSSSRPLGELLDQRQRMLVLAALVLCTAVNALDASIVAPALPHVLADLGGFHLISWVFTAYLLPSTVIVAIVGKVSDMMGRKPFLIAGVALFVVASAACGAATTMPMLIASRAMQGLGAGVLNACAFATIGDLFTPRERAKYISLFIATFTLSSLAGPAVGGALTDGPGWRWCFLINLPVGAIAIGFLWFTMPFTRRGGRVAEIDFVGSGLLAVWTVALLLALEWGLHNYGFVSAETLGLLGIAVAFLAIFLLHEARHRQAIFPPFLLRNRAFMQGNLVNLASIMSTFAAIQYLPTFIQTGLGASATRSGLLTMPQAVGVLLSSVLAGQMVSRTGRYKLWVVAGACLVLAGAFGLRTLSVGDSSFKVAGLMLVLGLGGGFVGPTVSGVIQSSVPHELMGVATSTRQFFMQIGQVMAVAAFGLVFTASYTASFEAHTADIPTTSVPADVQQGFHDPTLRLDRPRFELLSTEVGRLPDGAALLRRLTDAEGLAVSKAIDTVFVGALVSACVLFALALTLREIPLRATFASEVIKADHAPPGLDV